MSLLSRQIRSVRQAYAAVRYPGNLSRELLAPAVSPQGLYRQWMLLGGLSASAVAAAAIVLALMMRGTLPYLPGRPDLSPRSVVDWMPVSPPSVPVPHFHGLPVVPPYYYESITPPGLPSLAELNPLPRWIRFAADYAA